MNSVIPYILELLSPILKPIFIGAAVIAVILIVLYIIKNARYKKGSYYAITKTSYFKTRHDTGKHGEYLIYERLSSLEKEGGKFLFNVYLPKENDETTEIDVLLICSKGIFVFESKNYSGWIFGKENGFNWTQTLPEGRGKSHKEHFYNPIMQNKTHIKYLKNAIGSDVPMHSVIVFSERCTLKDIEVKSKDVKVINRYDVEKTVEGISKNTPDVLSNEKIGEIYNKLYPLTQVGDEVKSKHIENIKNNTSQPKPEKKEEEPVSETAVCENAEQNSELICPKCGGKLILRKAQRGNSKGKEFYGCSNYPRCRYIQNKEY